MKKIIALLFILAAFAVTPAFATDANEREVKNIIVLVGDGMSTSAKTLARWFFAHNEATDTFDTNFSFAIDELASGLIRNWWLAPDGAIGAIVDSAPAATAFACGVKTNDKFVCTTPEGRPVASILEAARLSGKATGLVATFQISHATPAAFSAHYPDRTNEFVIIKQQVYNQIDVVFGGGAKRLVERPDGENLIDYLKSEGYNYITTAAELEGLKGKSWGLFAPDAMRYALDRATLAPDEPTLAEMTEAALRILSNHENGFFLMVEGSRIDNAAHANDPVGVVYDIKAFDDALKVALNFARNDGQTMLLAFTDHGTGGLSIGNAATSRTYASDPVLKFIKPLKNAKLTGEGVAQKLNKRRTNIKEVMREYYGINDLTFREKMTIKAVPLKSMAFAIGPMISKRAHIGWTTHGHTGEDVVLYSYLPGDGRITGTIDSTDIAKICALAFGIDLESVSGTLFIDAREAFEAKGAQVELNNGQMTVTKGDATLIIPEYKNFAELNGVKFESDGVNVRVGDKFWVARTIVELLK
jgi:alkaline phosphatase